MATLNQIDPSDLQTTSLGELSGLPSWRSATVETVPSYSVRETRSHVSSRPCRSRVLPFAKLDGFRHCLLGGERSSVTRLAVSPPSR